MSRTAVWDLMAERKQAALDLLLAERAQMFNERVELEQRRNFVDALASEHEQLGRRPEAGLRFDASELAGRQYMVRLVDLANSLMIKQADLDVRINRLTQKIEAARLECLKLEKLGELSLQRSNERAQRDERLADEVRNLMLFNHHRGRL